MCRNEAKPKSKTAKTLISTLSFFQNNVCLKIFVATSDDRDD